MRPQVRLNSKGVDEAPGDRRGWLAIRPSTSERSGTARARSGVQPGPPRTSILSIMIETTPTKPSGVHAVTPLPRVTASVLLLLALSACTSAAPLAVTEAQSFRELLEVDEKLRGFEAYVPRATAGTTHSLILAFHGSGGSGALFRAGSGLDTVADRQGAIVVYPDAAVGNWAEDCGCNVADRLGVNDTAFVRLIIDTITARFPVDPQRIYAVGFSQGGLFVHRLACQMADRFVAVASIASPMSAPLGQSCNSRAPVSVLVVLGTADAVFPWTGGGDWPLTVLGAKETVDRWGTLLRCGGAWAREALPNRVADGTSVWIDAITSCNGRAMVALAGVEGGRHSWHLSQDVATQELVRRFFFEDVPGATE